MAQLQKFKPDSAAKIRKKIEKKYNRKFTFYEKYLDPPFNLRDKKKNIIEMTEQSFINEVWKTEEIE